MQRKPWNLASYPVYSLLTYSREWIPNMNIMTYVIPVSMQPKHYIIALYRDTLSLNNWSYTHRGILQILSPLQTSLVRILGKKSGKSYDKYIYLKKRDLLDHDTNLKDIAGYIELEEISTIDSHRGDHELFLCKVKSSRTYNPHVLMTESLIAWKIIL